MAKRQGRAAIEAAIEDLKKKLAETNDREQRRIGRIADKAGLLDLHLSDEVLLQELKAVAARFRQVSNGAAQPSVEPEGEASAQP